MSGGGVGGWGRAAVISYCPEGLDLISTPYPVAGGNNYIALKQLWDEMREGVQVGREGGREDMQVGL